MGKWLIRLPDASFGLSVVRETKVILVGTVMEYTCNGIFGPVSEAVLFR